MATEPAAVVDATVVVQAALEELDLTVLPRGLHAPAVMWSEALSALHVIAADGRLSPALLRLARAAVISPRVIRHDERELRERAWELADKLGWPQTYDAEYVTLAGRLRCPLVTLDRGLQRRIRHLVDARLPSQL